MKATMRAAAAAAVRRSRRRVMSFASRVLRAVDEFDGELQACIKAQGDKDHLKWINESDEFRVLNAKKVHIIPS